MTYIRRRHLYLLAQDYYHHEHHDCHHHLHLSSNGGWMWLCVCSCWATWYCLQCVSVIYLLALMATSKDLCLICNNPFYGKQKYIRYGRGGGAVTLDIIVPVYISVTLSWKSLYFRKDLDTLFFAQVYCGLKSCPSLLDNISLRVPTCYIRDFFMFSIVSQLNILLLVCPCCCQGGG
jgi:hypothetical protein